MKVITAVPLLGMASSPCRWGRGSPKAPPAPRPGPRGLPRSQPTMEGRGTLLSARPAEGWGVRGGVCTSSFIFLCSSFSFLLISSSAAFLRSTFRLWKPVRYSLPPATQNPPAFSDPPHRGMSMPPPLPPPPLPPPSPPPLGPARPHLRLSSSKVTTSRPSRTPRPFFFFLRAMAVPRCYRYRRRRPPLPPPPGREGRPLPRPPFCAACASLGGAGRGVGFFLRCQVGGSCWLSRSWAEAERPQGVREPRASPAVG